MGVKSFIKKSVAFVSAVAMACSMVVMPGGVSYAEEGTPITPSNEPQVYKTAELQDDGTYKITLESFVTGDVTVTTQYTTTPCDIVLVLDQSGSMADDMSSETTYTARQSQGYSYENIGSGNYYYKDNNTYYKVSREKSNRDRYYRLYYTKGNIKYYLSGEIVTTTIPNNITDRNSDIWTGVLYEGKTTTISRLQALKNAANSFIAGVEKSAKETKADHRVAVVGFASGEKSYDSRGIGSYCNTELFIGSNQYNYNNTGYYNGSDQNALASTKYGEALQSINDATQKQNLKDSINSLAAKGATHPEYGMDMANEIFAANNNTYIKEDGTTGTRDRIVVLFTDGEPSETTNDGFVTTIANNAISKAYTSKNTYNAKVYSIGIFSGADASADPTSNSTSNANKFMHFISSNYPKAQAMNNTGNRDVNGAYYKSAANVGELNNIFAEISKDTVGGSASITLGADAISKDIISGDFDLPEGITAENVKDYVDISTVAYEGLGKWSTEKVAIDDRSTLPADQQATISLDKENKTFNVSNFDFSANYVGDATLSDGTPTAVGKKLVIEITKVTAKHSGEDMNTNDSNSGIYTGTTLVKAYNEPKVTIPDKSYVLDYGKTVSVNAKDAHNLQAVTKLNTVKPAPPAANAESTGTYGKFDISSLATDGGLKYTPGNINWDGFDTAYVFGQVKDSTEYLWGAVNFIPASSVYYEDDFGSFTDENPNNDANVAIVWTGDWESHGTSDQDEQSSENIQYGWEDNYDNETGYSNGSTHAAYTKGATATFTFTGTGVDIYSRTDGNVGKVYAKLTGSSKANPDVTINKGLNMDNRSESGTYYQIPTLSFDNLEYGTYTVKLTVLGTSDSTDKLDGEATYYLDGIRVYNPLNKVTDKNTTVGKAYDEAGELNANYIKVRDILIDAKTFTSITEDVSGTVFIDREEDQTGVSTNVIGTFEDIGPKNEVYLKKDQGIAFNIENYDSNANVFIGLKAMSGNATTAQVTDGADKTNLDINSANDLYYVVNPDANGNVMIKNTGANLLSITKVRITTKSSAVSTSNYSLRATPALMSYAQDFDSLTVVEDSEETTDTDNDTALDEDDIEIENPSEEEDNKDESNTGGFWNTIINSINKWFGIK